MKNISRPRIFIVAISLMFILVFDKIAFAANAPRSIILGYREGKIYSLSLDNYDFKQINIKTIPKSWTTGLAYFQKCNKLVVDILGESTRVVEILDLDDFKLSFWETSEIGLGEKIIDVRLFLADPNIVLGVFGDTYGSQVKEGELSEYKKKLKKRII